MDDKPFYCKIVDTRITADVCERRIKQAKAFRDKGEPHASLNKCIICKGLVPDESVVAAVGGGVCPHCKRPRIHEKARSPSWVRCYGCYAVKNCAIYDAAVSAGLILEEPEIAPPPPVIEPPSCRTAAARHSGSHSLGQGRAVRQLLGTVPHISEY